MPEASDSLCRFFPASSRGVVNVQPGSLQWLPTAYPETFALTFARGVSARELLLRLGCPQDSLTLLTRDDTEEQELADPDAGHIAVVAPPSSVMAVSSDVGGL